MDRGGKIPVRKTITVIAKELGVSPSTVSKVINGRPGVRPEMRERISAYLNENGFRPSAIAKSMITGHTSIVGLVVGDVRNPFYAEVVYTLQQLLGQKGYMLMAFNSDYDLEKEHMFINQSIQYKFAGLLLISSYGEQLLSQLNEARHAGIAVVLINRNISGYDGSFVSLDNFQAGYIATKHLLDLGHRRITTLLGPVDSSASMLRWQGFRQAMLNLGLVPDDLEHLYKGNLTISSGRQIAEKFFSGNPFACTGIVIGNDLMALGFMDYCSAHQIKIPNDLSIVSIDNISVSGLNRIGLTSIDQNISEICSKAAECILYDIVHPEHPVVRRELVEPRLVVRTSTASPR